MLVFPPKAMRCSCKMLRLVVILSFVITAAVFAQSADTLYPVNVYVKDKLMYGYINRDGEIVIQPKYYRATDFNNGLAIVEIDRLSDLWACINTNDEILFTIKADYFIEGFSEGFAVTSYKNDYFFIDRNGNNVFNKTFYYANNFHNGFAVVKLNSQNRNISVINKKGEIVLDSLYNFISDFNNGYAKIQINNQRGIIDTNFNVSYLDTSIHFAFTVNENRNIVSNFIPVKINNKVGYIDLNGNIKINPVFERGNDFYEGLASVSLGGKWGFIDTTWKFVIEPKFSNAGCFSEGLAPVHTEYSINGSFNSFINKTGKVIIRDSTKYQSKFFPDRFTRNEIFWPKPFKNGICNYSSYVTLTIFERYVRSDGKFIWVKDLLDE